MAAKKKMKTSKPAKDHPWRSGLKKKAPMKSGYGR